MRRSSGNETLVEYFVPRSVSEFNLTGILNDTPPTPAPPPATGVLRSSGRQSSSSKGGSSGGDSQPQKTRDKMVTFEDDQVGQGAGVVRKNANMEDVFM